MPSSAPGQQREPRGAAVSTAEQHPSPQGPTAKTDWLDLVERIKLGMPSGMEDLYRVFSRGVRYYLCRQLGPQDLDDKVHDTFLIVLQSIKKGDLREPERLMGFVRTIVRRQVAAHIDEAVQARKEQADLETGATVSDHRQNPEEVAIVRQRREIMAKILNSVSARDRDILIRFYLREQSQEVICREMNLTETQFRLLKSRAKARFGELGKQKIEQKRFPFFLENCSPPQPLTLVGDEIPRDTD